MFFDFYVTLWGIISPKKLILVKIRLEKVDLGEVYIQKEQENFKKRSSSNTVGGPLHMSHPVQLSLFSSVEWGLDEWCWINKVFSLKNKIDLQIGQ